MATPKKPHQVANCKWVDKRWHIDGEGIHAGETLEMKLEDGWHEVRIETRDLGEILDAYVSVGGRSFKTVVETYDRLRRPK